MAFNLRPLHLMVFALLFAFFYLDVSAALGGGKVGSYQPIKNLNDPLVQEIAKFAVDQHNEESKAQLEYEKMVKGESQVVNGKNYKLVIVAKDGGDSHEYEAVVWDQAYRKFRKLTSFTLLK